MDDRSLSYRIDDRVDQEKNDSDDYDGCNEIIFGYLLHKICCHFADIEAIGIIFSEETIDIDDDQ